jgi:hypothetical protein
MNDRRDSFRAATRTGRALGLAAAGQPLIAVPSPVDAPVDDIGLINTALALEHEAIWAGHLKSRSFIAPQDDKDDRVLRNSFATSSGRRLSRSSRAFSFRIVSAEIFPPSRSRASRTATFVFQT